MTIKSIGAMKSHIYYTTQPVTPFHYFGKKYITLHLETMHELYPHFYFNDDCEHFIYSTYYPMDIHWIPLSILKYFTLDIQRQKSSFVVYFTNHFHRAFVYRNAVHFHLNAKAHILHANFYEIQVYISNIQCSTLNPLKVLVQRFILRALLLKQRNSIPFYFFD